MVITVQNILIVKDDYHIIEPFDYNRYSKITHLTIPAIIGMTDVIKFEYALPQDYSEILTGGEFGIKIKSEIFFYSYLTIEKAQEEFNEVLNIINKYFQEKNDEAVLLA